MIRVGTYQVTPSKRIEERKIQLQNILKKAADERRTFDHQYSQRSTLFR